MLGKIHPKQVQRLSLDRKTKRYLLFVVAATMAGTVSYLYVDRPLALYFHRTHTLHGFFEATTWLGRAEVYLIPALFVALIDRHRRSARRAAGLVFWSVALSGIAANVVKIVLARYRPKMFFEHHLYGFSGFDTGYAVASFPSGHTTTAFAAMGALALLFPRYTPFFLLVALLVAASRIGLGAHSLSDTIAGAILGVTTTWILYEKWYRRVA